MWRHLGSIGLILTLGGAVARASTINLSVSGLPTTYVPGSTLTFDVGLSGATDLNAYNVGLDLTSDKGTAGTDFYFVGSPSTARPPDGADSYVFDSGLGVSPIGFVATSDTVLGTNTALLNLSDFLATGQSVSDASPNTMLATAIIKTTPAAGDLTLSFDGSVLELLTPGGQPVPGPYDIINPPPVAATVPEPTSLALLCSLLGLGVVYLRRRRAKA